MPSRALEDLVNGSTSAHLSNVTAAIEPYGLPVYTAEALFDRDYVESEGVGGYGPILSGQVSDLDPDGNIDTRAQVSIDGDLYRVAHQEPDGTGFVRWRLEKL